jgi:hypothetical protein
MIVMTRTAQAAPGKLGEFLVFAKEVAAFIKSKHGTEVVLLQQDGGPIGSFRFVVRYENYAAYEDKGGKLMADPEYHKLLAKLPGIVIPGTGHDALWHSIQ